MPAFLLTNTISSADVIRIVDAFRIIDAIHSLWLRRLRILMRHIIRHSRLWFPRAADAFRLGRSSHSGRQVVSQLGSDPMTRQVDQSTAGPAKGLNLFNDGLHDHEAVILPWA
jgi:hypothetical protein